ncbi:uncharacterized protein TRAVEDRAFT_43539 [Trametes versicolor FP-101664 SS1]|uniref:uncharacterized protein n=1 Tax=Trametes versicolor (strain FP-101664) TaxID=717944 RepID=UPI00046229F0|nr:uncharacterized protein TRAVEDRAFT_43539 [Trametes versicolor FP-101664 SS1]EIW63234.1 hypothetical protein TRAVEDRAFT_43539 [Trametes versicolor FP-101664 SS1]
MMCPTNHSQATISPSPAVSGSLLIYTGGGVLLKVLQPHTQGGQPIDSEGIYAPGDRSIAEMFYLCQVPLEPIHVAMTVSTTVESEQDSPLHTYPTILQQRLVEAERLLRRIEEVEQEWDSLPARFVVKM